MYATPATNKIESIVNFLHRTHS